MKKITFKNLPDKTTAISANNLNQLQNNIEEAILNPVVESIKSKNLVNEIITGYTLNGTGGIKVDATQFVTGFMEVEAGKTYTSQGFKGANSLENNYKDWYTADKTFISNTNDKTATAPANAKYCRMNGVISTSSDMQFEEGSTATSCTPFKRYGYNSQESMGSIVVDDIRSKNLFNLQGNYTRNINSPTISGNSIILPSSDGNGGYTKFSQKIEVNCSLTFSCTISDGNGYARPLLMPLDSSGNVITDLTIEGYSYNQFYGGYWKECADGKYSLTLNFPSNVKFLQLGFIHVSAKFTDIQIEKGNTATSYTPYKNFDNTDNGWVDIELANTYSFLDLVAYNGLQYRKIGNQVFLRGMLINSVANPVGYYATCGFVPEECRPKKPAYLICNQEGGPCNCTVETDGGIRVYNTKANSWIALDSMRFFVD
jgi:hypothetical protein